jgi:hypothetical protein
VLIRLTAEKLVVPGGDLLVELAPNEINEIDVPVEARSNGEFPVIVELLTPANNALASVELQARVNALTGFGRAATFAAVLVLLSWWFTYFRKRRRTRRAADVADSQGRHPAAQTGGGPDDVTAVAVVAPVNGTPGGPAHAPAAARSDDVASDNVTDP